MEDEQKTFKQIGKFTATILENLPKLSSEEIQYWIHNPVEVKQILKKFSEVPKKILHVITSLSLEDRIKRGKYDRVVAGINKKNFPVSIRVDYKIEYRLFNFNNFISSKDVIKKMADAGYGPANIDELLAFGEIKKDFRKEFSVVELGSVLKGIGTNESVVVLRCDCNFIELCFDSNNGFWSSDSYFLGVR